MWKRWLLYLAVVFGCLIFYLAYQQWFAWVSLVAVLTLPWLSLLLSLPWILRTHFILECPQWLEQGAEGTAVLQCESGQIRLPCHCVIQVTRVITGEKTPLKSGGKLPSNHCGDLLCKPERPVVYDLLGLIPVPVRGVEERRVPVRPKPLRIRNLQNLERHMACAWRPKAGGGFAENHELRLYRPGDNLNQIHWKLSAKTGSYIIREPMIPDGTGAMVTMDLRGEEAELDRKLGRLVWICDHLVQRGLNHELRVYTGSGLHQFSIATQEDACQARDVLLGCTRAREDRVLQLCGKAAWHCHIGGEPDEV